MLKQNTSKKTKILILSTELDFGGVETSILSRAMALRGYNFTLEFACLNKLGRIGKELQSHGFKVHNLECNPKIQNFKNILRLTKLLNKVKPDILHTICIEANFHGAVAGSLAGIKKIIAEEVGVPMQNKFSPTRSWRVRQVSKLGWKKANTVLAISQAVKEYLIDYEGASDAKIKIIPHFVDPKFLYDGQHKKNTGNEIIIGCVGRLSPEKGQKILLNALKIGIIKTNKLRLWFIGDGADKQPLQKLSEDLGVGDYVKFWGIRDDISELMKQMDIFVLPSLNEGFGIAILEAMASGLPVIASEVGGVPEIVEHGVNGILVPAGDADILAREILKLSDLTDNHLENMLLKAKKTVTTKYAKDTIVSKFIDLYTEN